MRKELFNHYFTIVGEMEVILWNNKQHLSD